MIFNDKEHYGFAGLTIASIGFGSLFGWEWGLVSFGGCLMVIYIIKAIHAVS